MCFVVKVVSFIMKYQAQNKVCPWEVKMIRRKANKVNTRIQASEKYVVICLTKVMVSYIKTPKCSLIVVGYIGSSSTTFHANISSSEWLGELLNQKTTAFFLMNSCFTEENFWWLRNYYFYLWFWPRHFWQNERVPGLSAKVLYTNHPLLTHLNFFSALLKVTVSTRRAVSTNRKCRKRARTSFGSWRVSWTRFARRAA